MDRRWKVLSITSVGLFMASLDLFIVNIAFPDIAARLQTGPSMSEPLLGAERLRDRLRGSARAGRALGRRSGRAQAGLHRRSRSSFSARLGGLRRRRRRSPFLVGARVVQAVGGAMMLPATLGLMLPAFPAEQRAIAVGIWSAVGGVAAALGPPIGGLLRRCSAGAGSSSSTSRSGWSSAVVALALARRGSRPECGRPRPTRSGRSCSPAASALLTAGIVKGPDWGWADPRIVGAFVAGGRC